MTVLKSDDFIIKLENILSVKLLEVFQYLKEMKITLNVL